MTAIAPIEESVVVAPVLEQNQLSDAQRVTNDSTAKEIMEMHLAGLEARRRRDLLSEKLLLHVDGSGDLQFAELYDSTKLVIPDFISPYKKSENLLRLIVDNAVAHHTSTPFKFHADSRQDRRSREKALMDSLWINSIAWTQDLNGKAADALYMSMSTGFCPIHTYWCENSYTQHEPINHAATDGPMAQIEHLLDGKAGHVEIWVGNPFDTVFNNGSKRGSVHWCSYGRVLPAQAVRDTFGHMPGVMELQGTDRVPSASQWQRIASKWNLDGIGRHGSAVVGDTHRSRQPEELMTIVCREVAPGFETAWPRGRLQIIAVPEVTTERSRMRNPVLLYDNELPGGDFSFENIYSHQRSDDVLGKPWIEDLDSNQVDLNIALSEYWEYLQKMKNTPMIAPGGALPSDMLNLNGYDIIEVDPSLGGFTPRVPQWPAEVLTGLEKTIAEKRQAIWRGGGYQAASRGESAGSRQAAKAIMALQVADNSVHAPVNMRFRRSMCNFAQKNWKQMKMYGDIGMMVDIVGDDYQHMAEPYIDRTKLSDRPPSYRMVNSFGPSPELRAQELLELMQVRGGDGMPFLLTEEARRAYPNQDIFVHRAEPKVVALRRAKEIASKFHVLADDIRENTGFEEWGMNHPWVKQYALAVWKQVELSYPIMRNDDLQAHINSLTEITQDETADPIARHAALRRLDGYYAWQAKIAAQMMGAQPQNDQPAGTAPKQSDERAVANEMAQTGGGAVLG